MHSVLGVMALQVFPLTWHRWAAPASGDSDAASLATLATSGTAASGKGVLGYRFRIRRERVLGHVGNIRRQRGGGVRCGVLAHRGHISHDCI
jgi:hypothetical protein